MTSKEVAELANKLTNKNMEQLISIFSDRTACFRLSPN